MSDIPRDDIHEALEKSINLFRKAHVGDVTPLQVVRPKKVLLVLDGSSQDPTGVALAGHLRQAYGCRLAVVDARETDEPDALAKTRAAELEAEALDYRTGESYEQILRAVEETGSDLAIVPCPYGRNLESVGADSTGTVIDVLLARSTVPLLVVRKPFELAEPVFRHAVLLLWGHHATAQEAARWAAGLCVEGGRVELMLSIEDEFYHNVVALLEKIRPEMELSSKSLADALAKSYARLYASLKKTGAEQGFGCELTVSRHDVAVMDFDRAATEPLLVVLALDRAEPSSQGDVHDRIRHCPDPVLIVAGG